MGVRGDLLELKGEADNFTQLASVYRTNHFPQDSLALRDGEEVLARLAGGLLVA